MHTFYVFVYFTDNIIKAISVTSDKERPDPLAGNGYTTVKLECKYDREVSAKEIFKQMKDRQRKIPPQGGQMLLSVNDNEIMFGQRCE